VTHRAPEREPEPLLDALHRIKLRADAYAGAADIAGLAAAEAALDAPLVVEAMQQALKAISAIAAAALKVDSETTS
jgi:hypothetical protein